MSRSNVSGMGRGGCMVAALVFVVFLALITGYAYAETLVIPSDTKVSFQAEPWIDIIQQIANIALKAAMAAVMLIVPFWARPIIYAWHLDKIIADAASAALLKASQNLKDKLGPDGEITIDVKNAAVADAVEMVLANVSSWLISLGGGKDLIAIKAAAWVEKQITSSVTTYAEVPPKPKAPINIPLPPAVAAPKKP